MHPFFSVVIPSYNRKLYVQESIDSVLAQRFSQFEIIVVDDGSTDGSYEFLKEKYRDEKRIQILRQPNLERGAARNTGIKAARGKYIQLLDSDDRLLPEHLEILHSHIIQLEPSFISTKFKFIVGDKLLSSDNCHLPEGFYTYRLFLQGNPLACNVCIKKDNPKLRFFEEDRKYSIKEDWMFFMENLSDQQLYLIDKVTVHMLEHKGRSMHGNHQELIQKTFLAADWIKQRLNLSHLEDKQLYSHVNYFSAVHSYIEGKRFEVFSYLWKSISLHGLRKKHLLLFMKNIPGHRMLKQLKEFLRG